MFVFLPPDDHSNNTAGLGMLLSRTFIAACLEFHGNGCLRTLLGNSVLLVGLMQYSPGVIDPLFKLGFACTFIPPKILSQL